MGTREPFWQPSRDLHSRDLGLRGDTQARGQAAAAQGFGWAMEEVRNSCQVSPLEPGRYPGTTTDIEFRNYKPHSCIENHQ